MSVIVPAKDVLNVLVHYAYRYDQGEVNADSFFAMIERTRRQLQRACWCDEGVCCQVHDNHSSPHRMCVLR